MASTRSRKWYAVFAGIFGAIISFICVAIANLILLAMSGSADPSLVASLVPLALGFFIIVAVLVALSNGILWAFLSYKLGVKAAPWMLLSLLVAFLAPVIALLAIIFIHAAPSIKLPKTNELICCCGLPGIIAGLLFVTFWLSYSKAKPSIDGKSTLEFVENGYHQKKSSVSINDEGRVRKGIGPFVLGLIISILTAVFVAFIFSVVIFFVLQAEINIPSSSGGFPLDMSGLDTAIYILLSLIVSVIMTLGISLTLLLKYVAVRMSSTATKIINPLLFTLLSFVLNISLDFLILMILFFKFNLP